MYIDTYETLAHSQRPDPPTVRQTDTATSTNDMSQTRLPQPQKDHSPISDDNDNGGDVYADNAHARSHTHTQKITLLENFALLDATRRRHENHPHLVFACDHDCMAMNQFCVNDAVFQFDKSV